MTNSLSYIKFGTETLQLLRGISPQKIVYELLFALIVFISTQPN